MRVYPTVTGPLMANSHPGSYTGQDAFSDMLPVTERDNDEMAMRRQRSDVQHHDGRDIEHAGHDARPAICRGGGGETGMANNRHYCVRRLTPLECWRLQGFPDWWTEDVEGSDSAQYKAAGNSLAIPCAADVLARIAKEAERNDE